MVLKIQENYNMKVFILITSLFLGLNLFGQTPDAKVIEHLGEEKATELFSSNLAKYNHLLDFINQSWYVQDVSFKDLSSLIDFRTVTYTGTEANKFDDGTNFHIENFNPLLYNVTIQDKYPTTFKLGETGKIIVFYSREYFLKKIRKQ